MADIEFILKIPESLAESAREVGVLNNERLLTLLQDEVNGKSSGMPPYSRYRKWSHNCGL